jgi:hypothetical protein
VVDGGKHSACVDAWLEQAARGLAPEAFLRLFEMALGALWNRTATTLGEVTLTAIAERVLHNASETFSLLWSLKVEPTGGIQCQELRERIGSVQPAALVEAARFVLVELLTVLGHLTAEILTPELHAALSRVSLADATRVTDEAPHSSTAPAGDQSEEKRSWRK